MKLFIATTNPGKLRDFAAASRADVVLAPLPDLKTIPAPSEDEPTFAGNARVKAIYYSQRAPNEIVIADDSGLEVDALHGAPGVRSARFADDMGSAAPGSTDERNNLCLLAALALLPGQHKARYHCVLAAARNGQLIAEADGSVEGEILSAPRGTEGFGYDPLFYLPAEQKTMAELDARTKLSFSHRGQAFARLLPKLQEFA